jgi:very-short-patch-repair endonuclease
MVKLRGAESYPMFFGASPEIIRRARELRNMATPAEDRLWDFIRNCQLDGHRFRRQHPVNVLIVDFFCFDAMLAIEVDGSVHNEPYQKVRDVERSAFLNQIGINVLRFTNEQIENDIDSVLRIIKDSLEVKKS